MAAELALQAVFWLAVAAVAYAYVGYPLLLRILARRRELDRAPGTAPDSPPVACLVAAFNEQAHIAPRVVNLLAQQYPQERLRVIVGLDGCTDATMDRARSVTDGRLSVVEFPRNRGKASVLNDLVAMTDAPILVMTDANTHFAPDVVAQLVAHFADPTVGCVCGELNLLDAAGSNQDSTYWRMEQRLKRDEAAIGGLLGANGAIYAIRRALYTPLRPDTITDDFCIAMQIRAAGHRLVYESRAVATEDTPDEIGDEFGRRVRIGIGNYQALFRHPEYLVHTGWPTCWTYFSHKVLRWCTPLLMVVALVTSMLLAPRSGLYGGLAVLQVVAYGAALALYRVHGTVQLPRIVALPLMFLAMNAAFAVAFWRFLGGDYRGSWRRTPRAAQP